MEHREFWRLQPALLLALSFLIGVGVALYHLSFWYALCWLLYCIYLKKWASCFALPLASLYSLLLFGDAPTLLEPQECTVPFKVSSLQIHQSPFHRDLAMRGFVEFGNASLPCTIYLTKKERPLANRDYLITGSLQQRAPLEYSMKVKQWTPMKNSWSLAELRFQTKEKFRKFLSAKCSSRKVATLLSSLATGEVDDRQLRFEFGRLGLQHILAISGFHFGILISFFSLVLSLFLPPRYKWGALLFLITLYYLFIGSSPAVQRTWITVSLFLLAKLFSRNTTPTNLLGVSLLIELMINPLAAANLGFQLSFVCCFGLLLLYQTIDRPLRTFISPPSEKPLPLLHQMVSLLASTFRSAISLTLAVNLAIFPLLLYHFGKFPYLSLLYNLFFPFFISIALIALLSLLLLHLLFAPLAAPLFSLLDLYTQNILHLTSFPPLLLDYSLYSKEFSFLLIPPYLFLLFLLSLHFSPVDEMRHFR